MYARIATSRALAARRMVLGAAVALSFTAGCVATSTSPDTGQPMLNSHSVAGQEGLQEYSDTSPEAAASQTTCGEFCSLLNEVSLVESAVGTWKLSDVGYVDIALTGANDAVEAAVGTYEFDQSSATVYAYSFVDDAAAQQFAKLFITKNGEPDHEGPAYQDAAMRPIGTRLDFDKADADVVLWYGQNGYLFVLTAPVGLGNDFFLSFEW